MLYKLRYSILAFDTVYCGEDAVKRTHTYLQDCFRNDIPGERVKILHIVVEAHRGCIRLVAYILFGERFCGCMRYMVQRSMW